MAGLNPFRWSTTLSPEKVFEFCLVAAEFLRAVSKIQILSGQLITAEFVGVAALDAAHSLGRPYRGVILVASTNASGTAGVTALDARSFASIGGDPSKKVALGSASVITATLTFWVF